MIAGIDLGLTAALGAVCTASRHALWGPPGLMTIPSGVAALKWLRDVHARGEDQIDPELLPVASHPLEAANREASCMASMQRWVRRLASSWLWARMR